MLTSTELPCGVKMNNCWYVLDLLTRVPLHLSKGWASGWSRPSHLLMSRPVNLPLWLSGPTRPGVWSKALISGVALQEVCDVAGWSSPHTFIRFYSLDLDSTYWRLQDFFMRWPKGVSKNVRVALAQYMLHALIGCLQDFFPRVCMGWRFFSP